jgi:hypothetical protein
VVVEAAADDALRHLTISGSDRLAVTIPLLRQLAGVLFSFAFESSVTSDARAWVEEARPGDQADFGGATFSVAQGDGRFSVEVAIP